MCARLGTSHAHAVTVHASSPTPASLPYGKVCRLANGFSKVSNDQQLRGLSLSIQHVQLKLPLRGRQTTTRISWVFPQIKPFNRKTQFSCTHPNKQSSTQAGSMPCNLSGCLLLKPGLQGAQLTSLPLPGSSPR